MNESQYSKTLIIGWFLYPVIVQNSGEEEEEQEEDAADVEEEIMPVFLRLTTPLHSLALSILSLFDYLAYKKDILLGKPRLNPRFPVIDG